MQTGWSRRCRRGIIETRAWHTHTAMLLTSIPQWSSVIICWKTQFTCLGMKNKKTAKQPKHKTQKQRTVWLEKGNVFLPPSPRFLVSCSHSHSWTSLWVSNSNKHLMTGSSWHILILSECWYYWFYQLLDLTPVSVTLAKSGPCSASSLGLPRTEPGSLWAIRSCIIFPVSLIAGNICPCLEGIWSVW